MFKTTKAKVVGLIAVGVVALGGATYATAALATGGATAGPAPIVATQTATDPQLRANILEMLKDRMGLKGAAADKFADHMMQRMQNLNPNFDLQDMVNRCNQLDDRANTNGRGMMGGSGSNYGRGMMGGSGSNYGRGMMGGSGLN